MSSALGVKMGVRLGVRQSGSPTGATWILSLTPNDIHLALGAIPNPPLRESVRWRFGQPDGRNQTARHSFEAFLE
jgi:hypothetical protein